jgi:hypothetical protein
MYSCFYLVGNVAVNNFPKALSALLQHCYDYLEVTVNEILALELQEVTWSEIWQVQYMHLHWHLVLTRNQSTISAVLETILS